MNRDGRASEARAVVGSTSPAGAGAVKSRVKVETISSFQDSRGVLFEPLAANQLPQQANAHLVFTEPGCVRGNHYHPTGTEVLVLLGPGLVRFREEGRVQEIIVAEKECVRITIPPGVSHALQNPGTRPMMAISFNTRAHDRAKPDVVPDVLIPVTP
jgi:dTDP-4-dehydrorhamnose 3,5-epimerase-like enzyme